MRHTGEPLLRTRNGKIRRWAEERGAEPARVVNTGGTRDENPRIIRLDFTGHGGQCTGALEEITRDEWFQGFEDSQLAFVHQDETTEREQSNFNRLIGRETVQRREHGDSQASRREAERAGRASLIRGPNTGARKGAQNAAAKSRSTSGANTAAETSAAKKTVANTTTPKRATATSAARGRAR